MIIQALQILGILAGVAVLAGLACAAYGALVIEIERRRDVRRWDEHKAYWQIQVANLDRWCGYDFPILHEVSEYLLDCFNRGIQGDIQQFREKLRVKYEKD